MVADEIHQEASVSSGKSTKLHVLLVILLGVLGIMLVAWFVWPSRYKYTDMNLGMIGWQEVREDRFTGEKEMCGGGEWQRIEILPSGRITFLEDITVTVGKRGGCSRISWFITTVLAFIGVGEVILIFFLVSTRKRRTKT